ncbi:MAG: cytochrome C oxidase subunit IV family protein [Verrucomicrobia bacterium]|nr:cytochrome C oxidase subunit IV family protein [Verrucomicrobiota bacterium]
MTPVRHYALVCGALLVLLLLTVGAAYVNLGPFNVAAAMLISLMKAALILLFFMHVRQAGPVLRLFVFIGFFWLALLISLSLSDFLTRGVPDKSTADQRPSTSGETKPPAP